MCSKAILDEITGKVVQAAIKSLGDKIDRIILYGSYARGDYNEESDIDIMILADIALEDRSRKRNEIRQLLNYLELEYDVVLSIKVTDCTTYYKFLCIEPFYQRVERDGVILSA